MLKKISPRYARLGMFICSLEGNWLQHPFWRNQFLLTEQSDLTALQHSGVTAVWIDCAKGVDVAGEEAEAESTRPRPGGECPPPPAPGHGEADTALLVLERADEAVPPSPPRPPTTAAREELGHAARILDRSKAAIRHLFGEARLGHAIDIDQCLPMVEEINASVARNASALVSLARLKNKDEYTYMHSVSVCALMIALARQLGLDEEQIREAGLAGLLHDIGKMLVPLSVLNKPGKLTDDEFAIVRLHPERGHALLSRSGMVAACALDVCLHHHEKFDGTGYPHRLRGEQISYLARMGAICDVYDAITSCRPYKNAWDAADSLARMAKWEGHFDTAIFHAFVKAVGIYPLGSLVRLHSRQLGVVIEQNPDNLTRPVLRVFFSTRSNMAIPVQVLDLSDASVTDRIVGREDPAQWGFDNLDALWP